MSDWMEPLGALARGPLGLTGERLALAAAVVAAVALFFALAKLRRLDRRVRALERDSPAADDDSTQALRVALTGLPTRHLLFEMLDKQLAQARRYGSFLGIVVLDLDGLKAINEAYGLAVGDRVLQTTARRLTTSLREADFLAHLHGDAFGVVLTELERVENLLAAVQRLLAEVRRPIPTKGVELLVTASVGVASFPEDGADAARLMSRAEEALKRAKSRGGNNLQLYQESMNRWVKLRMDLQQDLRKALSGDQLEVHYQPQISLADGAVVGCEALVRWRHPRQGLLSAGKFIPLAEEIGIMPELGRWIVWEVCRQLAAWGRSGLTDIPISVNVSVRQFQHDDVGDMVRRALTEHRVVPERLWIELTESIAMEDGVDTATVLPELRGLGIKICLDDFGTGYSSLSFLAHHPVDVIKIDASFVAEAPASPLHASIVTMTVSLAESLGLEVVAEGVERPEHLAFLRAHGCGAAQGYLLGRPAPVGELEKLLAGQLDLRRLAAAG